ncbi:amino acid adenylation domain-containing protein [Pseudoalteromonas sp. C2R02]|uniref:amino acid adenylation domain-containing protein n=1 Tax=Pseudoalteromonas sp. C2R02 TaxID=2841565 RepID=UPI001C08FE63|nr:amino acid adenylation domain-containing protein [Pseudoalteromonas sp. C2R02]MBU2969542.1 amino acid adenylation domain-containing protein [Pseudoalteromonas sp. C2R02]
MEIVNKKDLTNLIEQQFWLLNNQGNGSSYNVNSMFLFKNIDLPLFITSVNSVVSQIHNLQSSFEVHEGAIYKTLQYFECNVIEKEFIKTAENDAKDWVNQRCYDLFEFSKESLVRVIIAKLKDSSQVILGLSIPHIIMDLRVKDLIAKLISQSFNNSGLCVITPEQFAEYNNYSDFITQQNSWLQSEKGVKAASYWNRKIKNTQTAVISSPERIVNIGLESHGSVPLNLSKEDCSALKSFCDQEVLSSYVVLLTAYYLLLARYSGETQFCIAVPLSNRKDVVFKNTLGCFVNTLPITIELNEKDNVTSALKKVRVSLLEAHRFQEFPSVNLIKDAAQVRGNRTLYRHGFTFEHPMQLDLNDVKTQVLDFKAINPQLDLFLRLWESDSQLHGNLEYDTSLFDLTFARRFADSLKVILKDLISDTNKQIGNLNCITLDDSKAIEKFNETTKNYHSVSNLKSLFEQQVIKSPNDIALVFKSETITYSQFNSKINQLANYLINQGINKGDVVAVMCERSIDMMIYIYSIVKVGAIYVPIDIELPKKRIDYMMMQSNVKAVLSNSMVQCNYEKNQYTTIMVDQLKSKISVLEAQNPDVKINPKDAAYIIFTSGSTGVPKGVVNSHLAISNRLLWMQEEFKAGCDDVILQKTPYSFDVSVWEIFWPLQVGAQLAIADNNSHRDIYELHNQIKQYNVTMLHFIPAMLMAFLSARHQTHNKLKSIFCSGESLLSEHVSSFYEKYPCAELINLYGPTEAAIDVSIWRCKINRKTIPIGKPIANTSLYVVDDNLQQLPIGVKGELLIGGTQVAVGYVGHSELTKKAFISNPFGSGKVYKTGDCARWNDDGSLEFLGRKDSQIKLNGIRVELNGVNSVIQRYPNISVAATTIKKNENGNAFIAAYYSKKDESEFLSKDDLKSFLATILPNYMLPTSFIELKSLPLTSSGKVNHKALFNLKVVEEKSSAIKNIQLTEVESKIHQVWCLILNKSEVSIDIPFFDLGGDSMSLMQVFSTLNPIFPSKLSSVDMFSYPTIRCLANFISPLKSHKEKEVAKNRGNKIKSVMSHKPRLRASLRKNKKPEIKTNE